MVICRKQNFGKWICVRHQVTVDDRNVWWVPQLDSVSTTGHLAKSQPICLTRKNEKKHNFFAFLQFNIKNVKYFKRSHRCSSHLYFTLSAQYICVFRSRAFLCNSVRGVALNATTTRSYCIGGETKNEMTLQGTDPPP
jgi:hypothetical protein